MNSENDQETNVIFDLMHPNREMFTRNGEIPIFGIIATHPLYSKNVAIAREKVAKALYVLMGDPKDGVVLMEQEYIEMESGETIVLTADSLVLSLKYEKGIPKMLQLELNDSNKVTIH